MSLSPKQIQSIADSVARINLWAGAVRSGKTYASLLKFVYLLKYGPPGNAMIVGVSRGSIQRNVLNDLCEMVGVGVVSAATAEFMLFGRRIYIVGANDLGAVRKIQGSTLALAYLDEAAVVPCPFFKMLLSRLSKAGAQLLATCNPEGPAHWLKREFVDRAAELNFNYFQFELEDNPSLSEEYKNDLKNEYTGVWYNRLILGEWAVAEGLIFDAFEPDNNTYDHIALNPDYYVVGVDYGTTNPTAAVMLGVSPHRFPQLCVEDTYIYDSKKETRSLTDEELADRLIEWAQTYKISRWYLDPSAASLKVVLQRRNVPVIEATNDVLPGIKVVSGFFAGQNLQINKKNQRLMDELQTYAWDPKAADRGQDSPLKVNDHLCDALRYAVYSAFPRGDLGLPDRDLSIDAIRRRAYATDPIMSQLGAPALDYF